MGKYYSSELIDQLMLKIPFEVVLKYYGFTVKGTGKNRGSDCPKCQKNHEHFKINTQLNVAKCFVCHWSGNPIQFIRELENIGFIPAVEKYAEIGNIELPNSNTHSSFSRKDKMLYHAARYYSQYQSDYLLKRGISQEVIRKHKIGYAKGGKGLKHYLNGLSFSDEELLEIGLIKERKNNMIMDYFYNCVIIPIFENGKIIDLYGRYTQDGPIKHLYLFGHNFSYNLDNCTTKYPILLVESIINALTIMSNKNQNVTAIGGTERFTIQHAKRLRTKGFSKAYIGYDTGDLSQSGQKAAIKTGYLLRDAGIESFILQMPENIDINELYLTYDQAHEKMKMIIREAVHFKEYEARFILDGMSIKWIQNYIYDRLAK